VRQTIAQVKDKLCAENRRHPRSGSAIRPPCRAIAAWVGSTPDPSTRRVGPQKWVMDGIEMSLSISGKALLHEYERRADDLGLRQLATPATLPPDLPPPPLPDEASLLRGGLLVFIQQHPEHRQAVAEALRHLLLRLAYMR
jgi:hypothetical protein